MHLLTSGPSLTSEPDLATFSNQNCSRCELKRTSGDCRSINIPESSYTCTCSVEHFGNIPSGHLISGTPLTFFSSIYPLRYSRLANPLYSAERGEARAVFLLRKYYVNLDSGSGKVVIYGATDLSRPWPVFRTHHGNRNVCL